ncbi:DNA polymerase IV [Patescibacteria group bacterium]|nr:DNA polymerase IV [Patescibacteria group bacterium]MCL5798361.1 DNA polymerase IV [Patescibacteria group bacterium]
MNQIDLQFNPKPSTLLHVDINSCFATIEQQANPKLRGKPIAVAAYTTPSGCILAPSVEAKKLGIKVGMRVKDGRMIDPDLIVLPPDPWKYRYVHQRLKNFFLSYTDRVVPRSIDEFVLDIESYPAYKKGIYNVGRQIKERIKSEIGEWLTVSVGIGPNRFLAKTAAGLHKPDGLDIIDKDNYMEIYRKLRLPDLCGIKIQNTLRLNNMGIYTVQDFYHASVWELSAAFKSIVGYYWYIRLHGWEIDDVEFARKSFGNSYALPKPFSDHSDLAPLLRKLVEKTGIRMRKAGYRARGIHVAEIFRDGSFWHKGMTLGYEIFDSRDIYEIAFHILLMSPYKKPVRELSISCFNLVSANDTQMSLLTDLEKKEKLVAAIDEINERWGDFVITPATMLGMEDTIIDRISFGNVRELQSLMTG